MPHRAHWYSLKSGRLEGGRDWALRSIMVRRPTNNLLIPAAFALLLGLVRLIAESQPWPFERLVDAFCIVLGAALIWRHFHRKRTLPHG